MTTEAIRRRLHDYIESAQDLVRRCVMKTLIIRHKIGDFAAWKKAYDAHAQARADGGLEAGRVTRSVDDASELILIFGVADLAKAKAFVASENMKSAMQGAGVIDKPDLVFVDEAA